MENGLRWKITNDRRTNENEKNFMADYIFHSSYSGVYQDCILDGEEFLIGEGAKMSRYIDADKVLEKINKICNRCGKMNENNGALCGACYFDDAKDIIDDFPTEEVRPDIPGEWIPVVDDEGFVTKHKCSKCNAIGFRSMNFCPECGSRNFRRKEKLTDDVRPIEHHKTFVNGKEMDLPYTEKPRSEVVRRIEDIVRSEMSDINELAKEHRKIMYKLGKNHGAIEELLLIRSHIPIDTVIDYADLRLKELKQESKQMFI